MLMDRSKDTIFMANNLSNWYLIELSTGGMCVHHVVTYFQPLWGFWTIKKGFSDQLNQWR